MVNNVVTLILVPPFSSQAFSTESIIMIYTIHIFPSPLNKPIYDLASGHAAKCHNTIYNLIIRMIVFLIDWLQCGFCGLAHPLPKGIPCKIIHAKVIIQFDTKGVWSIIERKRNFWSKSSPWIRRSTPATQQFSMHFWKDSLKDLSERICMEFYFRGPRYELKQWRFRV